MKMRRKKKQITVAESRATPLSDFPKKILKEVFTVTYSKCLFCGKGPVVKHPDHFKYQCLACFQMANKEDFMIKRSLLLTVPEIKWAREAVSDYIAKTGEK